MNTHGLARFHAIIIDKALGFKATVFPVCNGRAHALFGGHQHVLSAIEFHRARPIVHGMGNLLFDLRAPFFTGETRKTVLFVTHDIDEAIFMANRVAVFSARPGRIKTELAVDLPHPRHYTMKTSAEFSRYKAELTEQIRAKLSKSRKVKFINRAARAEIDTEYDYGASGKVSKESAKKAGKQLGVDYLLNGAIATNVQQVGSDKLIFYKLTMQLTNTETSADDCTEEVEVRKKYRKQSVSLF